MSRPISDWNGFLGQRPLVYALRRIADGAKAAGRTMRPILFTGPSGSGKTHLVRALARNQGTSLHTIVARPDLTLEELSGQLTKSQAGDCFFIDEIQSLPAELQEILFRLIDEGRIPTVGAHGSTLSQSVAPIVLIGATDRPGTLLQPLKRRFALTFQFGSYTASEMLVIVRQRATEFGMAITSQAAKTLSRTCRGIPRVAGQRLQVMRDFYGTRPPQEYSVGHIQKFMASLRIDANGMAALDRDYLKYLAFVGEKGASLRMLSCKLETDPVALTSDVEPFLVRQNYITIGPRGRVLTLSGKSYLTEARSETGKDHVKFGGKSRSAGTKVG